MARMLAYRPMKSLLAALLALAAAAHASEPSKTFATTLKPEGIHEECLRLEKGEKRAYRWTSDTHVDFNIHYHRGNDVFFPVKRDRMRVIEGYFTAPSREDYCWMWTALDKPAKLEGYIR